MTLARAVRFLIVVLGVVLNSCNGQTEDIEKPVLDNDILLRNNSAPITDGLIYFSYDNGLTCKNKNTGLFSTANIGLRGIGISGNKLALIIKDGVFCFNPLEDRWVNIPADKQLINNNVEVLLFCKGRIYTGTPTGWITF